ncbi:DUF4395 domain-containing protein [Paenibacillus arenilitoris]|uniref:DUF4395 domain-containing protein n=1 Tax=Paenibacillus arenilitoris TaxID=2772299 RepID=UPI00295B8DA8|nr:DUF4395 domain-containing protein [Paenibacillus arenilitoris]
MNNDSPSIPRPLVRTNQWVIVLSVILTWVTGGYWILAVPLIAGLMGVLFDFNPVMYAAKAFLKKNPSAYAPEDKGQQKFNQVLAILFLLAALVGYLMHWTVLAYAASAMVCLAASIAILGFCIGCFIHYQWTQYKYRSRNRT